MYSILVLNLGSTSFKFKCYRMGDTEELMASGSVERIGGSGSYFVSAGDQKLRGEVRVQNACRRPGSVLGQNGNAGRAR